MTVASVEHGVLKGLGIAGKAVGSFLGKIPVIQNGNVDEWLQEQGDFLEKSSDEIGREKIREFAEIRNTGSEMFLEKLSMMQGLFNYSQDVYIGKDTVYVLGAEA